MGSCGPWLGGGATAAGTINGENAHKFLNSWQLDVSLALLDHAEAFSAHFTCSCVLFPDSAVVGMTLFCCFPV